MDSKSDTKILHVPKIIFRLPDKRFFFYKSDFFILNFPFHIVHLGRIFLLHSNARFLIFHMSLNSPRNSSVSEPMNILEKYTKY